MSREVYTKISERNVRAARGYGNGEGILGDRDQTVLKRNILKNVLNEIAGDKCWKITTDKVRARRV
jgi:hypothetical protein